ncbi:MAG: AraC family transcriptional regulator [Agathobacter sp.]|nr:AraC family transcriptional regulator [Agathobacter sp.]
MLQKLRENIVHGTKEYPYEQYNLTNIHQTFQIPVHWHEQVEIIYLEQGQLNLKIGDEEFLGHKGDLFFVSPRELHFMSSNGGATGYYTLIFPLEFVSFQTMDDLETKLLAPLRSNQLLFPKTIKDSHLKKELLTHIRAIVEINRPRHHLKPEEINLSEFHMETRIQLIRILQKLNSNNQFIKASAGENDQKQRQLLAYIQEHFTEKISLEMMAREFHMSEKYISRYFVQHFHLTFSNYVQHLRLVHAKNLLETSNENVTDIALQSGFYNVSYFIRSFKKAYDISPLQYRKTLY